MAYIANESLQLIYNEVYNHTQYKSFPQKFEFIELLKTLNAPERYLIGKRFCEIPWNIGSLRVLNVLQKLKILTATEYILSLNDAEETQLILNDFLEDEYNLIGNLLINISLNGTNLIQLVTIVKECLRNLFQDLLIKPTLNNLNYLQWISTNSMLLGDIICKIVYQHIDVILELHDENIELALGKFLSWINEGVDQLIFPKNIYDKLLHEYVEESLCYLLKLSTTNGFRGWKFYSILLQTITCSNNVKAGPYLKKYLKQRLKELAAIPFTKESMLHFLITARVATACTSNIEKNLNNYADWYKGNISDMKFILSVQEFQNILFGFEQCIQYETEKDFLEIHAIISISPPVLCSKLVQTYKRNCKQKLQEIKCKQNQAANDIKDIISIEDSND